MSSSQHELCHPGRARSIGSGIASAIGFAFSQACFTVVAKIALGEGIPPLLLGGISMGIGCVLTCLYLGLQRRLAEVKQATRALLPLVKIGLTGTAINVCALFGLLHTTANNAAILTRTDIFFTIILGRFMLGERLTRRQLLASLIMLAGALRVTGLQPPPNPFSTAWTFHFHSAGDILVIFAAFFLGLNACQIKKELTHVPGEVVAVYNTAIMCLLSLAAALSVGEISALPPLHGKRVALILILGGTMLFFFLLYYFALSRLPAWTVRAFGLLAPALVLAMSVILLEETVAWAQIQGMLLVIAGGALIAVSLRSPQPPRRQ